jgi:hypothetical protein
MSYQCVFDFDEGATTVDQVVPALILPLLNEIVDKDITHSKIVSEEVIVPTIIVSSISPTINELMDKLDREGVVKVHQCKKDDIPFTENVF